ncbi:M50 family metallopeptidase [Desulfolucanica intricata]|uniref:M50 family metallopeptidase n=1 Tax=Desulfolucanica intricata TaxID=1285191 RepID=UPI000835353D|nr:M50 family metallopeptidase [Desulfolucanica intricata]
MRLGKILGVEIFVNPFFLGLIALYFVAGVLGKGLIAFFVVLWHEMAHAVAARRLGVLVSEVELLPFGGVVRMGSDLALDPHKETCVALAGPFSNIVLFGLGLALKNNGIWDDQLGPYFLQCNLIVALFNLLPVLPLDGGRVYRAFLAGRTGYKKATYRAATWAQVWAIGIVLLGAIGLAYRYCGLDVMVVGLFLFYAASREKSMAPYLFIRHLAQKKEELVKAGVLPAEQLVAFDNIPLGEIIRPFVPQKFHLVFLLDRQWKYKGVVTEAEIVDALLTHGVDMPVGEIKS